MNGLADGVVLSVVVCLVDKPSVHWNARSCWRGSQGVGPELRNYGERKPFGLFEVRSQVDCRRNCDRGFSRRNCSELGSLIILSGVVHTGVEVRRMDSEMSGLVEQPWLQLMCCAICLPRGCNFRWRRGSPSGSECWMVCRRWTPEIEFNKRLSSSIIRLANYSITTSLIYKLIL